MVQLLKQVRDYRGEGLPARLFYDGKVAEAVALVVERHLKRGSRRSVSAEDAGTAGRCGSLHHGPLCG